MYHPRVSPPPIPRRAFLHTVATGAALVGGGCKRSVRGEVPPIFSYPPSVVEVGEDSALLWVRTEGAAEVRVRYADNEGLDRPQVTDPVSTSEESDFTAAIPIDVSMYARGSRITCEPLSLGRAGARASFRAGPTEGEEVFFAWSADLNARFAPFRILDIVAEYEPDFMLLAGDLIYADVPIETPAHTLEEYRAKHRQIRSDPHLQRLLQRVPMYAVWDDHEVYNNFDREHPDLERGYQAFVEYWPLRAPKPPGMYRAISWGPDIDIFVLDCRRFRNSKTKPGSPKTMLGEEQTQWLMEAMSRSTAAFKFVLSSVPLLAPIGHDSWFSYRAERDAFKRFCRDLSGQVIILSADYHVAWELSEPDYGLHEFIAGPLASHPVPLYVNAAARTKVGHFVLGDAMNFGTVRIHRDKGQLSAEVSIVDEQGEVRHRVDIPGR